MFYLSITAGGDFEGYRYLPSITADSLGDRLSHELTRLYADPGTVVTVGGQKTSATGEVDFFVKVSGYLIDLP